MLKSKTRAWREWVSQQEREDGKGTWWLWSLTSSTTCWKRWVWGYFCSKKVQSYTFSTMWWTLVAPPLSTTLALRRTGCRPRTTSGYYQHRLLMFMWWPCTPGPTSAWWSGAACPPSPPSASPQPPARRRAPASLATPPTSRTRD